MMYPEFFGGAVQLGVAYPATIWRKTRIGRNGSADTRKIPVPPITNLRRVRYNRGGQLEFGDTEPFLAGRVVPGRRSAVPEYLQQVSECRRRAQTLKAEAAALQSYTAREAMLNLASTWEKLAETFEAQLARLSKTTSGAPGTSSRFD